MSLTSDISRGAAQTSRAVSRGAGAASHAVRSGAVSLGRAGLGLIRAILRSYNRGVFLTYTETGGNTAVKLSETPPTTYDFHLIELLAHRTISLAWLFGLLGSVLANSYRTSRDTATYLLNKALPEGNQITPAAPVNRHWFSTIVLGLIGVAAGLVVGVVGYLGTGFVRMITNSFKSVPNVANRIINLALADTDRFVLKADTRTWPLYILGLPGVGLGAVVGFVGFLGAGVIRSVVNSVVSLAQVFAQVTNVALIGEEYLPPLNVLAYERPVMSFVLGLPGAGLGLVAGAVGFLGAGFVRTVLNSLISLLSISAQITALAIVKEKAAAEAGVETQATKQGRTWSSFVLGLPGAGLGVVVGLAGFMGVVAIRSVVNSVVSLSRVFAQVTNVALIGEEYLPKLEVMASERPVSSMVLGLPGAGFGLVAGAVGFLGAGFVRTVLNSLISLLSVSAQITALAIVKEEAAAEAGVETQAAKQGRSWSSFVLGLPGAGLGVVVGLAGFMGVVAIRSVVNSVVSLSQVFAQVTNVALIGEEYLPKLNVLAYERPVMSFVLGLPGAGLGLMAGALGFLGAGVVRVVLNSGISLSRVLVQGMSLALLEADKFPLAKDKRTWSSFLLGLPGAALGIFAGAAGFLGAVAIRSLVNSVVSLTQVFAQVTNMALAGEQLLPKLKVMGSERPVSSMVLGLPGAGLGLVVGAVGFLGAGAVRVVLNSVITLVGTAMLVTNLALAVDDRFPELGKDTRTMSSFALGLPGVVLGAAIGAMGFFSVGIARTLINSAKTFKDLSGSIMNVALERAVFDGYKNDSTPAKRWGLGFPGAVLSILTAGSVGLTLLAMRKLIPILFGLVASPFIGLWRTCSQLWKYRNNDLRFAHTENATEQAFKDLFASLTAMGNLPEGKKITKAADGPFYTQGYAKNVLKFVRKALTFNQQTTTEKLLTLALAGYRTAKNRKDTENERDNVLAEQAVTTSASQLIADCQADPHWVTPDSEKAEMEAEISRVREFVKQFVNARVAPAGDPAPVRDEPIASSVGVPSPITRPVAAADDAGDPVAPEPDKVPPRLYSTDTGRMRNLFFNGRYVAPPPSAPPVEVMPVPSAPPAGM